MAESGETEELPQIPRAELTRYEDIRLGEGAFGKVYRGEYKGKDVAIKQMKATENFRLQMDAIRDMQEELDSGERHLGNEHRSLQYTPAVVYLREVQMFRMLKHPNIVRCEGITEAIDEEPSLIVNELARGSSLLEALRKVGGARLAQASLVRILKDIATGLDYLHGLGYIHGNLKPGNVLLSDPLVVGQGVAQLGPNNRAMLSDFGHSRRFIPHGQMNIVSMPVGPGERVSGTTVYMAPEAFDGVTDVRNLCAIDVYAFGMVVYELLMGKLPWMGEYIVDLKQDLCSGRRPDWHGSDVPRCYKDLAQECWQTDPSMRPDSKAILKKLDTIAPPPAG